MHDPKCECQSSDTLKILYVRRLFSLIVLSLTTDGLSFYLEYILLIVFLHLEKFC